MRIASPSTQIDLLQVMPTRRAETNGAVRNVYGQFAQEYVCAALGLSPIPINGSCEICLDAKLGDTYYEIKSVKAGGSAVAYAWRLKKEKQSKLDINYIFFIHSIHGAKVFGGCLAQCILHPPTILICSLAQVRTQAAWSPLRKISSEKLSNASNRMGYARTGYKDGYRSININNLLKTSKLIGEISFTFYNVPLSTTLIA